MKCCHSRGHDPHSNRSEADIVSDRKGDETATCIDTVVLPEAVASGLTMNRRTVSAGKLIGTVALGRQYLLPSENWDDSC